MSGPKSDPIFERLREQVAADLSPAPPLSAAWKRSLFVPLVWGFLAVGVLVLLGPRSDYQSFGARWVWSFALTQLAASYLLMSVGLRLTIPAATLPLISILPAAGLATGLHLGISVSTSYMSPVPAPPGREGELLIMCFLSAFFLGLVPLSVSAVLAGRGLAGRPLLVGVLCGLSGGLAGEAAWRLHCPISDLPHSMIAHAGAVLGLALAGMLVSWLWLRR